MDTSGAVVLEVSSDEDDARSSEDRSPNWFKELFDDSPEEVRDTDVLVIDELSCAPAVLSKKNSSDQLKDSVVIDDDKECVILDADPSKPVDVVREKDESDELLIVAEKGQLACRDYPHPRHLCATFPFSTTAHERYCSQCHCYVCDTLAPCVFWGDGTSSADHCHSTDKEHMWKLQRQSFRQRNITSLQKVHNNNFPLTPSNKFGSLERIPPCLSNRPFSQSQISSPLQACSGSTFSTSLISQRYNQQPTIHCAPRTSRSRMLTPNHAAHREKHTRILPPRSFPSPIFKRSCTSGRYFPSSNEHSAQQVLIANNTMVRRTPHKNRHRPAVASQSPRGCGPQHEMNNQCPSVISEKDANLQSFEDVFSRLESNTDSSPDGMLTSGWNIPQVQNDDLVCIPDSQHRKINLTGSPSCTTSFESDLRSPSSSQNNPGSDTNPVESSVTASLNSSHVNDTSLNNLSHMPLVKSQTSPVENCDFGSVDVLGGDWMSIYRSASKEIFHEPDMPPGLPSPEPFVFDFEVDWNGL